MESQPAFIMDDFTREPTLPPLYGQPSIGNLNKLVLFAAFLLLLPVAVLAQGSGSSDTSNKPQKNNFAVTRSVSGVLTSQSGGSIVVKIKNGENISLVLTNKTRFVTRPKVGQKVKVTYSANDKKAIVVTKL